MIENGQNLKLCQKQHDCLCVTSHSINTKHKAFRSLSDPLIGLREGVGARKEGWEGSREEIESWERM